MSWSEARRGALRGILALVAVPLLAVGAVTARDSGMEVAVLGLEHRPAQTLLPQLQALFGDAATLRADGFRLLVRADPRTLEQIRKLLAELDTPRTDLLLSVRRSSDAPSVQRSDRLGVEAGPEGVEGRLGLQRRRTTRRNDLVQQVRLHEGSEAVILVGETRPDGFRVFAGRAGVGVEPLYRDTRRGFRVQPQVLPDSRVQVKIRHLHEQPLRPGTVDRETLETRITLEPGQWHDLTRISQKQDMEERGLATRHTTRDRSVMTLQIRLDPAP
ncbi:MAG: secretin N-terminal domain-containing protein [Pseudomonadota bacterium]